MRRGEIWWADLPPPWGRRPVLLLSRNQAYSTLTWLVVAPLTTTIRNIPTAVHLDPQTDDVPQPSIVNLDGIQCIRKEWLDRRVTRLQPAKIQAVERAIHIALALST